MTRGCPHQIYAALWEIYVCVCLCAGIYTHTHSQSEFILRFLFIKHGDKT